jgi:uncharacterized membrane protein
MATRTAPKTRRPVPPTSSLWSALYRHVHAQIRFLIALAVGLIVALAVPLDETIPRILAGWNAGGWLFFALVAVKMWRAEIEGIKREADIERESRIAVLVIVVLGSLFTLLALVTQLGALKTEHGLDRTISVTLSVSTIFLSWLLMHLVFAIYYAHEFHGEGRDRTGGHGGGLSFPGESTPDYLDFLYFSFVVGTTAQTSDVEITSRRMRRVVMLHGILSFVFNTAVIALTVNLAAQLVQG